MPVDYFPNGTISELTKLLESLQRRATMGELNMVTSMGDQQMRSFQGAPSVKEAIRRVLYSLYLKDPEAWANPYTSRVRRVRPDYSGA